MYSFMLRIVAIDDNPGDIYLLREAVRLSSGNHTLAAFTNAESAASYLRGTRSQEPQIILLDINLPGLSGIDFLRELKKDKNLQRIPVIVLSTSSDPRDILAAYDSHASCYIVKRMDVDDHLGVLMQVVQFWASTAQLPYQSGAR